MVGRVRRKATVVAIAAAAAGLVGACGSSPASPRPSPAATTIAVVSNPKLGMILVDGHGRTVYLFVADQGKVSSCYDACASAWPPVLSPVAPHPGDGAQPDLLGVTTRTDGSSEVTYGGHPLYYFVQDKKAGDTKGQDVEQFGGLWRAVSPGGTAVVQPVST
ncbi:MAG: hypothetical protein QOG08_354 [Chloroflexota bacterium]|nr:hypothetical protein [Chloroflexota bacterium]